MEGENNMNIVTTSKKFKCDKCGKQFTRKDSLKNHVRLVHEGKPDYICPVCQKGFVRKRDFTVHCENVHKGKRKGPIPKVFSTPNNRFNYETLFCQQCDYSCKQSWQLTIHVRTKHEGERHNCSQCDKKYTHKQDLNKHIKAEHEGRRFKCDLCNFEAKTKTEVKGHNATNHTSREERVKYSCNLCLKFYFKHKGLKDHIRADHEGHRFKCDLCDHETKTKSEIKAHKDRNHISEEEMASYHFR